MPSFHGSTCTKLRLYLRIQSNKCIWQFAVLYYRFFIDADGTIFTHVLNFLRSSQLPPRDIAETVYKEALVWGLGELISALEAVPPVMIKICKENTRNVIPGYKKFISSLTEWISDDCKENVRGKTTVYIALQEADNGESEAENFYQNHICFGLHEVTKSKVNADLYFGPWRTAIQATGNEMIGFVVSDLTEKGFEVFDSGLVTNQCQYFRHSGEGIKCCRRHLFYLTVQWWSNPFKSSRSKKVNFAIDN